DGFRVIEGYHVTGLFNRAAAVNTAAQIAGNWDVAVVADADAWVPEKQLREAVRRARATGQVTSALSEVWMLPESVSSTILRAKGVPANITRPQVRKIGRASCRKEGRSRRWARQSEMKDGRRG